MMLPRSARSGFTLIELTVALAVGSLAVLAAHTALAQLTGAADRIFTAARRNDREANADQLLRATVGQLEVGTRSERLFRGDATTATFATWCDMPEGWSARCTATVDIDPAPSGSRLRLTLTSPSGRVGRPTASAPIVIREDVTAGGLRYLNDPSHGGRWFATWPASVTAPLAIGVVLSVDGRPDVAGDTLILRIGPRG